MKTNSGTQGRPPFKIIGTNADLQRFAAECKALGLEVSEANSFFRDDYEHCLMPCYAYDEAQRTNLKLQTLSADVFECRTVYDLATQYSLAMAMVEMIQCATVMMNEAVTA